MNHRDMLPQDVDTERALLATLAGPGAIDPGSTFAEGHQAILAMSGEWLMHPAHRDVLAALKGLYTDASEVNALTLKAEMERQGTLARIGGFPALLDILGAEEVSRPMLLVNRLKDLWRSRSVIRIGHEAQRMAIASENPINDTISELASRLSALAQDSASARIVKASALLDKIMAHEPFREPGEHGGKLVWTGIPAIDDEVEASAKHVVMIAARPGIGKTALAIQGALKSAAKGQSTLLISLEMDQDEVEARLASRISGESYKHFRTAQWTAGAAQTLIQRQEDLDRIHIWAHPSGVPWPTVEAVIRDAARIHGITSAWIDHILLVKKPDLGKGVNDAACWTSLSRSKKRLAQELGICIVSLCQLNREGDNGEPKLSDLKDSGGWEEDANAVVMLWAKDPKAQDGFVERRAVMMKLAKNRSGAGFFKRELTFQGAISRFDEVVRTTGEPKPEFQEAFL